MTRPQAVPTVQDDNEFTRVIEWRFAPGAETGWHIHEYAYVVVPMLDGTLQIEMRNGDEMTSQLSHGVSYSREAGAGHNVINASDHEFYFVEVEFKDRPLRKD
ncbi:MAG: cupin domain-containing protein [Rhodospirillaceae bacterium]|nr:cupin domain-containing protein [Rhodospirillaceae bacterium]